MKKIALSATILGTMLVPLLQASPAQAQSSRTWVSGVGDDVNPCSRTAPCKTFSGAISKTFINGEINCLDPGGFGTINITKSMTLSCEHVRGSILSSGVNGVIINIAAGNANDPLRTVRIRGLDINGTGASGTVGTRTGINGIRILAAAQVYVEETLISDFSQAGIRDERTAAGRLNVANTVLRNNGTVGLQVQPSSGSPRLDVAVSNVHSMGNAVGMAFVNGAKASVKRSVMSNNVNTGLEADNISGGFGTEVAADDNLISNNGTGIFTIGAAALRLSNSDVTNNATAANGAWTSYGNNRLQGNGAAGTAPTAAGGQSHDLGQQ